MIKTGVPANIGVMSNWSYCSCFTVHLPRVQMYFRWVQEVIFLQIVIKSSHENLYVNTHPNICYIQKFFPKVKACIAVSYPYIQVKTSNLILVLATGLKLEKNFTWNYLGLKVEGAKEQLLCCCTPLVIAET